MIDTRRIISWLKIGHSAPSDATRHIGYGIQAEGYKGLFAGLIEREYQAGIRRWLLHNPGGTVGGRHMAFDQFIECRYGEVGVHPKLPWAYADLANSAAKFLNDHPGCEVIAYIGVESKDFSAWRVANSTSPILQSGMSMGLDACTRLAKSSAQYKLAQKWSKQGRRIYVEPAPFAWDTQWHDLPSMHAWQPNEAAPPQWPSNYPAERIVLLNRDYENREMLLDHTRQVLATGATVGYRMTAMPGTNQSRYWGLTEHKITMEEMFA